MWRFRLEEGLEWKMMAPVVCGVGSVFELGFAEGCRFLAEVLIYVPVSPIDTENYLVFFHLSGVSTLESVSAVFKA